MTGDLNGDLLAFNAADGTCSNTGNIGTPPGGWNAANGSSAGWQQWSIDLGPYANSQVEVSITALSDWGLQQFFVLFIVEIYLYT